MALASDKPMPHIPYRDATLTKMLKKVLTGNCLNMMLACINPTVDGVAESHNTLRYAMQASRVINQTRTQTFEEMIGDDPLRDDCFDPNEELNYRTEVGAPARVGDRIVDPHRNPNPHPNPNPNPNPNLTLTRWARRRRSRPWLGPRPPTPRRGVVRRDSHWPRPSCVSRSRRYSSSTWG